MPSRMGGGAGASPASVGSSSRSPVSVGGKASPTASNRQPMTASASGGKGHVVGASKPASFEYLKSDSTRMMEASGLVLGGALSGDMGQEEE